MGRWTERYGDTVSVKGGWTSLRAAEIHNADCDTYEAKIAELESRLARIAALVKPVPVADLVEAGTEAPALLAERRRQIRAILEDESNG